MGDIPCSITDGLKYDDEQVPNNPDPDQEREFYYIDAKVKTISLSERTQLAINQFNLDCGDRDIEIGLLREWLRASQDIAGDISATSDSLGALENQLRSSLYQGKQG